MSEYKDKVEQEQGKDTTAKVEYTAYEKHLQISKEQQTSTKQEDSPETDTYIRKWTDSLATDYLE